MKWRALEADGNRTKNAIYNAIAAKWRPVKADGNRKMQYIIAAKWRPVEVDRGQVETVQDMQITIARTRTKAFGDSKLYNTIIEVTSLHPINIIDQLSIHRILSHNSPQVPFPFRFYSISTTSNFSFLAPFLPIQLLWSKVTLVSAASIHQLLLVKQNDRQPETPNFDPHSVNGDSIILSKIFTQIALTHTAVQILHT